MDALPLPMSPARSVPGLRDRRGRACAFGWIAGGVAVMFAVHRRMRPRDAIDLGQTGPVISDR